MAVLEGGEFDRYETFRTIGGVCHLVQWMDCLSPAGWRIAVGSQ